MFKKNSLQVNTTTQKNFSYSKGSVILSFNLRTDIKSELKDLRELLLELLEDVNKELN